MSIRFYNSLTRKIEDFVPIKAGQVSVYFCGPTVYSYVHIGNLRAAMFNDLLCRYLRAKGLKVTSVVNITDVDDKIIKALPSAKKSLAEYTDIYTKAYLEDLATLGIVRPDIMPKATQEISGMVELIQALLAKGHAYKASNGDVYFKIDSFPNYGALINLDRSKLRSNADGRMSSDEYDKDNAQDFALWKAYDPADGDVFWDTPIGKGRPGWHIECSAMSTKYLGKTFDIHGGGIDLLFPHHTNEIAQSECGYGCPFAKIWMHNAHLMVNGKKMSKSLGNYFTLRDLLARGHDPMAMRYELLKAHYRDTLDFREDNFTQNLAVVRKFSEFTAAVRETGSGVAGAEAAITKAQASFFAALDDDLNISLALTAVHELISALKGGHNLSASQSEAAQRLITIFDSVLGLFSPPVSTSLNQAEQELFNQRLTARKNKDFKRSDELRDELLKHGVIVKDSATETTWKRK